MFVYAFVVGLALVGQVGGDDRYGAPPSGSTPVDVSPPLNNVHAAARNVGPPPSFAPATRTAPTTTAEDYGYGIPSSSPPAATTKLDAVPGVKPAAMMRAMLAAPSGSRLIGRPVRLAEVVAGASSREGQSQRIEAYWDLCSAVADYYLGVREQDELQRLRATVSKVGPTWQQAESELGVRIGTSERAAVASQHRLASLMNRADATSLPLPADLPHCGDYNARYEQIFAGRQSPEARELSALLPMRYEELKDAALATTRAEEFLVAIAAQRNSASDGTGTLRALELLALRRRAFVQIARDYNRRIARYTELASPGEIDPDRLIGMLIQREDSANTATRPSASAPPLNRQSQVPLDVSDQTFAAGWESIQSAAATAPRDENVKPAAAESKPTTARREHSLLVPSE